MVYYAYGKGVNSKHILLTPFLFPEKCPAHDGQEAVMDTKIKFLYLSEPDMIRAGVKNMDQCVDAMEDLLLTLNRGDYMMAGVNHNSHGAQVSFPDNPQFEDMPKNADDRRFMAMPAYLGGKYKMAGMKWYGSNVENKAKGLPRSILMMMLNDKDTGAPLALMSRKSGELLPYRCNPRSRRQVSCAKRCSYRVNCRTGCYGKNLSSCIFKRLPKTGYRKD